MMPDPTPMRRHGALFVFLLVAAIFWLRNPVAFVSEDCYFYAVVARNLALRGVQSFWGSELTNGVHPLWLYVLTAWEWCLARLDAGWLYRAGFGVPLVVAITGLGAAIWMRVTRHAELPAASVFVPLLFLSLFGLLYSEAHAAFLAHTILAGAVTREARAHRPMPVLVGLALAGVALARLDNVFYVAAFCVWYSWRHTDRRAVLMMAGVCAVPVAAYLGSNAVYFGGLVPISGALKSTFPVPHPSGLAPSPGGMVLMWSGYSIPFGWLPLAVGTLVTMVTWGQLRGTSTLLYPLLAGTLGHALYTSLFTAGFTFWYWYYLLPVVLLGWSLACLTARMMRPPFDLFLQWSAVCILTVVLLMTRREAPTEARLTGLKTLRVVRELGIADATILVSEWPGTVAFHTRNQIVAADMLTANRRLVDRLLAAPDAGPVLLAAAREGGTPVDYVVVNGGPFLVPASDRESVDLRSPWMVENQAGRTVGRLVLGPVHASVDDLLIWRVPSTVPATTDR